MKLGTVICSLVFGVAALAAAVWIGRSAGELPVKDPAEAAVTEEENVRPEIAEQGPYPKAVVDEPDYDFGVMRTGAEASHTFVIRNEGEAPLVVKKGGTSCSCTMSKLADDEVPPGESVEVTLKWKPRNNAKSFQQNAKIWTNDPENREIQLTVGGRIAEALRVEPPTEWKLNDVSEEGAAETTGIVVSGMLDEFQILDIESEDPHLSAEAVPLNEEELARYEAQSGYKVKAVLEPDPDRTIGPFRKKLTIHTDVNDRVERQDERFDNLVVYVRGTHQGPIQILATSGSKWYSRPMVLDMGRFPAEDGKTAQLSLFIDALKDGRFKILDKEIDYPFLKVHVERDKDFGSKKRERYLLRFEVTPGHPPDVRTRERPVNVKLETNHPAASEMTLRVIFVSY